MKISVSAKASALLSLLIFLPTLVFANWVAETPLSTPCDQFTGGVINGKIYLVGGDIATPTSYLAADEVEIYDTISDTWNTGPSLPQRTDRPLTVLLDKAIYVISGITNDDIRAGAVWTLNTAENGVVPDVKANGSDSSITISQGNVLSFTVFLDPGSRNGDQADWWLVIDTPLGWYHYDLGFRSWMPGLAVTYQGPLLSLSPPIEMLSISGLPIGTYAFYFGVDMLMNGSLDMDQMYYDGVVVNIEKPLDSIDLRGTYIGSLDATATECSLGGEDDAFTLSGSITVSSPSQVGGMFNALGELSIHRYGFVFTENITLSGTVTAEGKVSGTYTETFAGTNGFYSSGNGTFTGSAAGNALSFQVVGQDTDVFGETCVIRGTFTGFR